MAIITPFTWRALTRPQLGVAHESLFRVPSASISCRHHHHHHYHHRCLRVAPPISLHKRCQSHSARPVSAASVDSASASDQLVRDVMTSEPICVQVDTSVESALELLIENRINGFPVVDENNFLIGIVSDYDLLALDSISHLHLAESAGSLGQGASNSDDSENGRPAQSLFPRVDQSWTDFNLMTRLLDKAAAQTVGDCMTRDPLVVKDTDSLDDATRMLLSHSSIRRLPVVDMEGRCIGLITRGTILREALKDRKQRNAGTC